MRLAQDEVRVSLSDGKTATLTNTGNYMVIWVEDLAALLNAVKENKVLREKIKELEAN